MDDVPETAKRLGLEPHPEGGWYRQTWASAEQVTLPDGRVRPTATLIWFLLSAGESSTWHRVRSDELWLAHSGVVRLELGGHGESPEPGGEIGLVGVGPDEVSQALVPAGEWQRTLPGDAEALVSCLVSPGFHFDDFELLGESR
ncbi:MAG TPA: cupin domain-containing protein [Nocardioidaceae bacterium]|nr:cupin domain-containing protein [Nocardioidaceae bacterium]